MEKGKDFYLIDAPVSAFSKPEDIRAWISELKQMEDGPEVREAIKRAEQWLELAQS